MEEKQKPNKNEMPKNNKFSVDENKRGLFILSAIALVIIVIIMLLSSGSPSNTNDPYVAQNDMERISSSDNTTPTSPISTEPSAIVPSGTNYEGSQPPSPSNSSELANPSEPKAKDIILTQDDLEQIFIDVMGADAPVQNLVIQPNEDETVSVSGTLDKAEFMKLLKEEDINSYNAVNAFSFILPSSLSVSANISADIEKEEENAVKFSVHSMLVNDIQLPESFLTAMNDAVNKSVNEFMQNNNFRCEAIQITKEAVALSLFLPEEVIATMEGNQTLLPGFEVPVQPTQTAQ